MVAHASNGGQEGEGLTVILSSIVRGRSGLLKTLAGEGVQVKGSEATWSPPPPLLAAAFAVLSAVRQLGLLGWL